MKVSPQDPTVSLLARGASFQSDFSKPRTSSFIYWAFFCTLLVFLSRVMWYDLRTIYAQRNESFSLTPFFVLWTLGLLPAIGWTWSTVRKHELLSGVVVLYLILIEHTLITGLVYGHAFGYIVQELIKYLFVPTGFLLAVRMREEYSAWEIVKLAATGTAWFIIARGILYLMMTGGQHQLLWGTANELIVFSLLFAVILVDPFATSTLLTNFLVPLACGLSLFGQKRSLAVCFVVMGCISTLCLALQRASLRRWVPILVLAAIALSAVVILTNTGHFRKLVGDQSTYAKRDQNRRMVEVNLVWQEIRKQPSRIFFGFGGGATLYLPTWLETKSAPEVHSIHNTPAVLLYRHGLLGLLVFLVTIGYGVTQGLRMLYEAHLQNRLAAASILGYKFLSLLASLTMFGIVDDMLLGIFAGILYRAKHTP